MNILTSLREASGNLSRHRLATLSGLHHDKINRFESGRGNLSDEDLNKISRVLSGNLQLAYIAGLFDRSSSWGIVKVNPNPKNRKRNSKNQVVSVGPVNYPVYCARIRFTTKHKLLASVLENFFQEGFTCKHGDNQYVFFAANKKAKVVAEILLPYLVLKRQEALNIIELTSILETYGGYGRPSKKILVTHISSGIQTSYSNKKIAAENLGIPVSTIVSCLRKSQKTIKNGEYTAEYLDERAIKDMSHHIRLEQIYQQMRKR